jgi:hypothetical protein
LLVFGRNRNGSQLKHREKEPSVQLAGVTVLASGNSKPGRNKRRYHKQLRMETATDRGEDALALMCQRRQAATGGRKLRRH